MISKTELELDKICTNCIKESCDGCAIKHIDTPERHIGDMVDCLKCGETFKLTNPHSKYCQKCRTLSKNYTKRESTTRICPYCKIEFDAKGKKKYCCREHQIESNKLNMMIKYHEKVHGKL